MTKISFQCDKCKHEWIPKTEQKPKICPKCKTKKVHENSNINTPIFIPNQGESVYVSTQEYVHAKKIVDEWEALHGGPGSLRRLAEQQDAQVQP